MNRTVSLSIALGFAAMLSVPATADEKTRAVLGAGVGGAVGAAVGDELGDRKGAIIGSAVGAAIGTAVATDGDGDDKHRRHRDAPAVVVAVEGDAAPKGVAKGYHCPPGQAKKGRC